MSPEAPTRVAALSGSLAQIWLLRGARWPASPRTPWRSATWALGKDVVNAGSLKTPSAELILAAGWTLRC